jgi:hypothetical protein
MPGTIGDTMAPKTREEDFKKNLDRLIDSTPTRSMVGKLLAMLKSGGPGEERSLLISMLKDMVTSSFNTTIPFKKNQGGFDPFSIDPDQALLPDVTTDLGKVFDPGITEFMSPERAAESDPRALDTRDYMRIPEGTLGRRFFRELRQSGTKGI